MGADGTVALMGRGRALAAGQAQEGCSTQLSFLRLSASCLLSPPGPSY